MNHNTFNMPELMKTGHLITAKKKTTLLNEGDICQKIFIIEQGCVRSWFNSNGDDVTFQFFFEGDVVTSFESLKHEVPALYNIETISDSRLRAITRTELFQLINEKPAIKNIVDDYIMTRLYHYQMLFISRIRNTPQQRYDELLKLQPNIFSQVPHHYIATYLGITPVSLSRIRSKNKGSVNNC